MPQVTVVPITPSQREPVRALMLEEEEAWMSDLAWDYSSVRQTLVSFLDQDLLPGYIALDGNRPVSYSYYLSHRGKGIIGSLYAARDDCPHAIAFEVLGRVLGTLRESDSVRRIEAQLMPFHDINLTPAFTRFGFQHYTRYFVELQLAEREWRPEQPVSGRVIPWSNSFLRMAADVAYRSYRGQLDAVICEDYRTLAGCEGYLRSLVENPGCGIYLPDASFIALDEHGAACGFIIGSQISDTAGMIPQVAMLPSLQGRGFGGALMNHALASFKAKGCRTVSLTVSRNNRRAFDWYHKLGFRLRKEFGAYVWDRP
jgi:ribosomal protein S18 acetylase RimI-like enzyme